MAKRKTTTKTTTARASKGAATRATTKTETEEVVPEAGGPGWETGVAIITSVILVVAILFVDYQLGHAYGSGMFFK